MTRRGAGVAEPKVDSGHSVQRWSLRSLPTRLALLATVWLLLAAAGQAWLLNYANRPGSRGDAPRVWPREADLDRSADLATLLVFAHPKCPCTRATLDELAWVMARCGGRVDCRVYFLRPDGVSEGWTRTDCWRAAAAIPCVTPREDPGGRLAKRFGARTSGHAFLYDTSGRLQFEGGITPSRGHRGGNRGRERLVALVSQRSPGGRNEGDSQPGTTGSEGKVEVDSTCVFGCPLESPGQNPTRPARREDRGA